MKDMTAKIIELMFGPKKHYGFRDSQGCIWLDNYAVDESGRRTPLGPELSDVEYAELRAAADERFSTLR
jgi:hypothetical protein